MTLSKAKALIIVFALFLVVGIITVGCKQKSDQGLVNTNSLPGRTFTGYAGYNGAKNNSNSKILYLGSDKTAANVNFGPKDVSFNFKDLK